MIKKEKLEYAIGDGIAWRSGQNIYCGLAITLVKKNENIRFAWTASCPKNVMTPSYLVNLGRDLSKDVRVILSTTHKLINNEWVAYPAPRIKAFVVQNLQDKILKVKPHAGNCKEKKDEDFGIDGLGCDPFDDCFIAGL